MPFYSSRYQGMTIDGHQKPGPVVEGISRESIHKELHEFISGLSVEDIRVAKERARNITFFRDDFNRAPPSEELRQHYQSLGFSDIHPSPAFQDHWYTLCNKLTAVEILREVLQGRLTHLGKVPRRRFISSTADQWSFFVDFEQGVLKTFQRTNLQSIVSFDDIERGLDLKEQEEKVPEKYIVEEAGSLN